MKKTLDALSIKENEKEIIDFLSGHGEKIQDKTLPEQIAGVYAAAMTVYADRLGDTAEAELTCRKSPTLLRVSLSVPGTPVNPLPEIPENSAENYAGKCAAVQWSYKDGINYLMWSYRFTGGVSQIRQVLFALAAAIVFGLLCSRFLPEKTVTFINDAVVGRLYGLFMRILGCVSGPLIFLSIVNGIYSIGDSASFGRIGKALMLRYVCTGFALGLAVTAILAPVFGVSGGAGPGGSAESIIDMVLDVVPENLFSPFIQGNTLQIIFLAFIIGITMVYLGSKTSVVSQIVEQSQNIVTTVMKAVGDMIYIFVFLCIFRIVAGGKLVEILSSYKLILLTLACFAAVLAFFLLYTGLKFRVPPRLLLKKLGRPFIICLTTASSAAALPSTMEVCEKDLGISRRLTGFGVPLGQVVFSIGAMLEYVIFGLSMGKGYGVPMTVLFYIAIWFVSVVLSMATPPVPGALATCFSVLIAQLGIPTEAVAICISLSVLLDYASTAVKMACIPLELMQVAKKTGELDESILKKA